MALTSLAEVIESAGFNLFGVVSVSDFDAKTSKEFQIRSQFRFARTALVIGTGGRTFWKNLSQKEKQQTHSIDRATETRIGSIARFLKKRDQEVDVVFPFRPNGERISFRRLAELGGLGTCDTVLGILIHSTYGPWVSLRACILTNEALDPTPPLIPFSPCAPCAKPCIDACPARAIRVEGFELRSCGSHQKRSNSCEEGCLSRLACVYGQDHKYLGDEGKHRQQFAKEAILRYVAAETQDAKR